MADRSIAQNLCEKKTVYAPLPTGSIIMNTAVGPVLNTLKRAPLLSDNYLCGSRSLRALETHKGDHMSKKAALLLTALLVVLSVLFSGTALAHTSSASGGTSASTTPDTGGGGLAHTTPVLQYVTDFAPTVECAITTDPNYDCGPH